MKKTILLAGILAWSGVIPAQAKAESISSKEEVQSIIKEYLVENPEVIVEALESYSTQQKQKQQEQASSAVRALQDYFHSDQAPFAGNKDAPIKIVEFFDYNCGFCKKALPDVQSVLKDYDDVKVVFQEMPILSPSSQTAAKWALAAHKQGKYFEYHTVLMSHRGRKSEDVLEELARETGLDIEQMKKDVQSDAIKNQIEKSLAAARDIGINGTPAFIVNETVYRGYLGEKGLKQAIEKEREKL